MTSALRGSRWLPRDLRRDPVEALGMIAWMDSLDLLITVMTMPVMTGIELAARFQLRWPALPVLVISGYVLDPLSLGLAGCAAFLPKPFSSGTLLDAVHHVMDSALRAA